MLFLFRALGDGHMCVPFVLSGSFLFPSLTIRINLRFPRLFAMVYWQFLTKWPGEGVDIHYQSAANLFYYLGHVAPSLRFLSGKFHPGWLLRTGVTGSLELMQLLLGHRCRLSRQVLMGQ